VTLEENERRHVAWVLGHCGGNRSKAATLLGIDDGSLWRKIKKYGLA
jgi:DNA-binding protein Fis